MKLFYRTQGKGQPLIIIHGLFGSSDNWLTITKKIAETYGVYLIDMRNHGRSPQSTVFTYSAMVNDLFEFIQDHAIIDPIILGHSMGGKVAMHFALAYPDKIKKLIVVDIAPKYYSVHHATILKGLNAIPLDQIQSRQEAENILAQFVPEVDVRQFLLKNLYRTNELKFEWRINLSVLTKEIEQVGIALEEGRIYDGSTLFIRGEKSNYIQSGDEVLIKKIFPKATIQTISEAGHWVQVDAPEPFFNTVNAFITST